MSSESKVSRRVLFPRAGEIQIESIDVPPPGPGEIRVRTRCSLISAGTEVMFLHKMNPEEYPFVPGYSNVGLVESVGPGVSGYAPGDRVVSHGRHAEWVIVPANPHRTHKVPDGVPDDQATLTVLASVALHGVRSAELRLDEPVLVLGQGHVGQITAQFARLAGARPVVVADFYESRLKAALGNGAHAALNPAKADLNAELERLMPGGPSVVFDCTASPKGIRTAIAVAGQHARIMLVTSVRDEVVLDDFTTLQRKELAIFAIHQPQLPEVATPYYPWTRQRLREYILKVLAERSVTFENLISLRMPGTDAAEAYRLLQANPDQHLGALLLWDSHG